MSINLKPIDKKLTEHGLRFMTSTAETLRQRLISLEIVAPTTAPAIPRKDRYELRDDMFIRADHVDPWELRMVKDSLQRSARSLGLDTVWAALSGPGLMSTVASTDEPAIAGHKLGAAPVLPDETDLRFVDESLRSWEITPEEIETSLRIHNELPAHLQAHLHGVPAKRLSTEEVVYRLFIQLLQTTRDEGVRMVHD